MQVTADESPVLIHLQAEGKGRSGFAIMAFTIIIAGYEIIVDVDSIGEGLSAAKENAPVAVPSRTAAWKRFQKALRGPHRARENRKHSEIEFIDLGVAWAEKVVDRDPATCAIIVPCAWGQTIGDPDRQAGIRRVRDFVGSKIHRNVEVQGAWSCMEVRIDIPAYQSRLRPRWTPWVEEFLAGFEEEVERELFFLASASFVLGGELVGGGKSPINATSPRRAPEKETRTFVPDVHAMLQAFELAFLAGDLLGGQRAAKVHGGGRCAEEGKSHDQKQAVLAQHAIPRSGTLDDLEDDVEVIAFAGAQSD